MVLAEALIRNLDLGLVHFSNRKKEKKIKQNSGTVTLLRKGMVPCKNKCEKRITRCPA